MDIRRIDKLTSSQRAEMVRILLDKVSWGEHILRNRDGSPRVYWEHQTEDLRCPDRFIIHRDGRKVGKSIHIVTDRGSIISPTRMKMETPSLWLPELSIGLTSKLSRT